MTYIIVSSIRAQQLSYVKQSMLQPVSRAFEATNHNGFRYKFLTGASVRGGDIGL